jgi:hypothetical protein
LLLLLDPQILAPSKATPDGFAPTGNVPMFTPSIARSLVTLWLLEFATRMWVPSKATEGSPRPTMQQVNRLRDE